LRVFVAKNNLRKSVKSALSACWKSYENRGSDEKPEKNAVATRAAFFFQQISSFFWKL